MLTEKLSVAVNSLTVLHQQTKFFHWTASGGEYFHQHKFLDDLAEKVLDIVDLFAERLVFLGGSVTPDLAEIASKSVINVYNNQNYDYINTFRVLNKQISLIVELLKSISDIASSQKDFGTDTLIQDQIYELEQFQYHIRQFIK